MLAAARSAMLEKMPMAMMHTVPFRVPETSNDSFPRPSVLHAALCLASGASSAVSPKSEGTISP